MKELIPLFSFLGIGNVLSFTSLAIDANEVKAWATTILGIISVGVGVIIFIKKNWKTLLPKSIEDFEKIRLWLLSLIPNADDKFASVPKAGVQKKAFVMKEVQRLCSENNINFVKLYDKTNMEVEKLVNLTKKVNVNIK